MSVSDNIAQIREIITQSAEKRGVSPESITLVGASKMKSSEDVRNAVSAGIDALGENRVQEMTEKLSQNAYDGVPLHFIGHLQKNKIRQVVGKVSIIQSVDSLELMKLIDARAKALGISQETLIQINIGREDSKTGFLPEELDAALEQAEKLGSISVKGLMAIPPNSPDEAEMRGYFQAMHKLFVDIGAKKYDNVTMDFLSMGMTGDYPIAIEEGANMVRVGSGIFGSRQYVQPRSLA